MAKGGQKETDQFLRPKAILHFRRNTLLSIQKSLPASAAASCECRARIEQHMGPWIRCARLDLHFPKTELLFASQGGIVC